MTLNIIDAMVPMVPKQMTMMQINRNQTGSEDGCDILCVILRDEVMSLQRVLSVMTVEGNSGLYFFGTRRIFIHIVQS